MMYASLDRKVHVFAWLNCQPLALQYSGRPDLYKIRKQISHQRQIEHTITPAERGVKDIPSEK